MARLDAAARLEQLTAAFSALSHPTRRQILLVIRFRGGAMTAGDIAGRFHYKWPTVSRHLRVLETTGLLVRRREGRQHIYRLSLQSLGLVKEWIRWLEAGKK
ncbi:MAG: metalloregulator ArsR/SmtB family transcription factor [Acidobacteriota bacterium]|nr:metalloregulator ArsR/SmtB family transcription factor [Acidobacteriota bacterium]